MSKLLFSFLLFFISSLCHGQPLPQLAPPLLKYPSVFFKNTAIATLQFAQQGTKIYYTLNNKQPTLHDKVYAKPILIKKSFTTLKAMVYGNGFLPSEIVAATFIRDGLKIQSIQQTPANERFQGNGKNTLIDNEGGITAMNAKNWLGYQQDTVEVNITLQEKQKLQSVLINFLEDHGSWIFLPEQIQLFYFDEGRQFYELMAQQFFAADKISEPATCKPILITASKKTITKKIKIKLMGIKSLPEGHPGKGQHGWIFIDEIKCY